MHRGSSSLPARVEAPPHSSEIQYNIPNVWEKDFVNGGGPLEQGQIHACFLVGGLAEAGPPRPVSAGGHSPKDWATMAILVMEKMVRNARNRW